MGWETFWVRIFIFRNLWFYETFVFSELWDLQWHLYFLNFAIWRDIQFWNGKWKFKKIEFHHILSGEKLFCKIFERKGTQWRLKGIGKMIYHGLYLNSLFDHLRKQSRFISFIIRCELSLIFHLFSSTFIDFIDVHWFCTDFCMDLC